MRTARRASIVLSLPYGMSARNVLRSSIYPRLRDGASLTLLTSLAADEGFLREFGDPDVAIRPHPSTLPLAYRGYRLLLDTVEGYWFTRASGLATPRILADALRRERPALYWSRVAVGGVLGRERAVVESLRRIQGLFPTRAAVRALAEARAEVLVLTHPLAIQEFPLAFAARRLGIPVVALIHSWDNLSAKSGLRTVTNNGAGRMLPLAFDRVLVWNELQAEELVRFYGYGRERVVVTGVPQFDLYHGYLPTPWADFCRSHGLDPARAIVTYAAGSEFLLRDQASVIATLLAAMDAGAFGRPAQLIVRGHPGSALCALRERFAGRSGLVFDEPSPAFAAVPARGGWRGTAADRTQLADLLAHSAVVINVSSTLALDCAMLDRPTVCVAYDGGETRPYHQSVRKHYDFTHYAPVVASGGVRLATSPKDLVVAVREYLDDPSKDAEGRRKIVRTLCHRADGRAGERVAAAILETAPGARRVSGRADAAVSPAGTGAVGV